ncbi:MAG: hypothetical protein DLM63_00250 [Solirubrobacterales bacterium]|nr:MAG: hypothetical protein DLM63_00250 [Solirubrobacterales bacterium]
MLAGDPLVLSGRLTARRPGRHRVVVLERLAGTRSFRRAAATFTDAHGRYLVIRPPGAVISNRSVMTFVGRVRSPVATVVVLGEVSLRPLSPATSIFTLPGPVLFAGRVVPRSAGARILLQDEENARWTTVAAGRLTAEGRYAILHNFAEAGVQTVRVMLPATAYAAAAVSSPESFALEQKALSAFSVATSANPVDPQTTVTLSGTVSTVTGANRLVTLFARPAGIDRTYPPVQTTTTDGTGHFSFTDMPLRTTAYEVRAADGSLSNQMVVAMQSQVALTSTPAAGRYGAVMTFAGAVTPVIFANPVQLQRLGADGAFHTIAQAGVRGGGGFVIRTRRNLPGISTYRVVVTGANAYLAGASAAASVFTKPPLHG